MLIGYQWKMSIQQNDDTYLCITVQGSDKVVPCDILLSKGLTREQAEERIGRAILDYLEMTAKVPPSKIWK